MPKYDKHSNQTIRKLDQMFQNPIQNYILPIYERYMGIKKNIHPAYQYGQMGFEDDHQMDRNREIIRNHMIRQSRGGGRRMMQIMEIRDIMGMRGMRGMRDMRDMRDMRGEDMEIFYLNEVQKKLLVPHITSYEQQWKQVAKTFNQQLQQFDRTKCITMGRLEILLGIQFEKSSKVFPFQLMNNCMANKKQSIDTLFRYYEYANKKNQWLSSFKESTKSIPSLENSKTLVLNFLTQPTADSYVLGIRNLEKKLKKIIATARKKQQFKFKKLEQMGYCQQSIYNSKIKKCIASIGLSNSEQNISKEFIMNTYYTEGVDKKTLSTLNQSQWLDNRVIVNLLEYLKNIESIKRKVAIFNHSESDQILRGNYKKDLRLTDCQRIIFLVNDSNQHWYVIGVFHNSKTIAIYDSMYSGNRNYNNYASNIKKRINMERANDKLQSEDYQFLNSSNTIPQNNSSDCGVCSIINIMHIFDNKIKRGNFYIDYSYQIVRHLRHALYLMLGYFGYCYIYKRRIRKDYFSFLIRNTIYAKLTSSDFSTLKISKQQRSRKQKQLKTKKLKQQKQSSSEEDYHQGEMEPEQQDDHDQPKYSQDRSRQNQ